MHYYNEHDPKAAAWLRELIARGLIPAGVVDERSIVDVRPHEVAGFVQQHYFAGIGGWPLALRLAGWPDDRPVRTGSCPCQPFSQAGKRKGTKDERHLWPVFRDLITFGEPAITFGEQVASADGRQWLAGVRVDLEGLGYAVGAADLCAAGCGEEAEIEIVDEFTGEVVHRAAGVVGPPHIRQRLFWVGVPDRYGWAARRSAAATVGLGRPAQSNGCTRRLGHADDARPQGRGVGFDEQPHAEGRETAQRPPGLSGVSGGVDYTLGNRRRESRHDDQRDERKQPDTTEHARFWSDFYVVPCGDGKTRRVGTGIQPLVDGLSYRVGSRRSIRPDLLRGAGNAIVPQLAAEFILAAEEAIAAA